MINVNVVRDLALFQRKVRENPQAVGYYFQLPNSPHTYQYYQTGKEIFGAVFAKPGNDVRRDFRSFIPKIEPN